MKTNGKVNEKNNGKANEKVKECGVLLAVTSLPSPYGVGTLGKAAYDFIDLLKETGQKYWQMLPVNQTGFGDSPYAAVSVYAGSEYLIDLDILCEKGYLKSDELVSLKKQKNAEKVDYGELYRERKKILKKAFNRYFYKCLHSHSGISELKKFAAENEWVAPYALFRALKEEYCGAPWLLWSERDKKGEREIDEYDLYSVAEGVFLQAEFYSQYAALKAYAAENGIKIIGDLPIYPALDSAEVWHEKRFFDLDKKTFYPERVAGVPPDYFSQDGQLWGNPVYDWKKLKKSGYSFWIKRVNGALKLYDVLRLDHFRGFESFYSIPYGNTDGRIGEWQKGGGNDFIRALNENFDKSDFIAEDLGIITPEVEKLLKKSGYPGMKVLQFAFSFDEANPYLPKNHVYNSVVYTGTHDNDTLAGWLSSLDESTRRYVCDVLKISEKSSDFKVVDGMIKAAMQSKAKLAIVPFQDYLRIGSKGRMNVPSSSQGNWTWRIKSGKYTPALKKRMLYFSKMREE